MQEVQPQVEPQVLPQEQPKELPKEQPEQQSRYQPSESRSQRYSIRPAEIHHRMQPISLLAAGRVILDDLIMASTI